MVDRTGLENRRTARYRGFESLSLRKVQICAQEAQFILGFFVPDVLNDSCRTTVFIYITEQKTG